MGAVGCRFGRNVPLAARLPRHRQPAGAQPARGQPRADDARPVPAGDHPQPAGGGLDSVHGPRLVRAQALEDRGARHADAGRRRLGRAVDPRADVGAGTGARRVDAAARLRQSQQPLVGLRRRSTAATATWRRRCAPTISGKLRIEPTGLLPVDPETGVHFSGFTDNWWIGLAMLHTIVHAGAQLHLRSAGAPAPALERRAALSQGQADQLGADGQDPHRRVDAGDRAAPAHQAGDERQLVGPRRRGSTGRRWSSSTTRSCSAASSDRRPITTPRRTRSPRSSCRSTACTR